jgi:hypothetical protein
MFEIFKRIVNNEVLVDLIKDAQLVSEREKSSSLQIEEAKPLENMILNYQTPSIRAQSILILSKHWKPFDSSNKKSIKTEEDGFIKMNQLVSFISQMLDTVSKSKSSTIDA